MAMTTGLTASYGAPEGVYGVPGASKTPLAVNETGEASVAVAGPVSVKTEHPSPPVCDDTP